jgi:hypothetical protein
VDRRSAPNRAAPIHRCRSVEAVIRRKLEVGVEILDGWVVSHLPQINEREIDGQVVSTDVWVDRKGSDELHDKLELY